MKAACGGLVLVLVLLLTGCGRRSAHDAHDHASSHGHAHVAPHGGTAVVLGDEAFHVEFVRDAAAGTLTAYVLDAHMEDFVRLAAPEISLTATIDGVARPLSLLAVGNPATGETEGDTAEFVGQADWLKSVAAFDAVLPSITVRGITFTDVHFNFPHGNEAR